ncbi:type II toxin-antitoxin system RelE/ParE family toxin [Dryocola clanedunensis]|uniref:type II toxin-antitoxin system RelE/ParE family toxin n=1 Tax=Cedecea sulfonylureivorans TaxID=3051154 RepID=UPI0019273B39|nr:type II toxin-antitoxin system RelE/ParE family toxin [Cedecea sulfonylureivorans]
MPYTAKRYRDNNGKEPYTEWMKKLRKKDVRAAAKIDIRVARAETGNFGDHKFERDGVWELRVDYGPGYRVYYSVVQGEIVLLLIGGDKSSQHKDLEKAAANLQDYYSRLKS